MWKRFRKFHVLFVLTGIFSTCTFSFVSVTATANITKIPQKSVVQDQDESATIASSENTQDSSALGIPCSIFKVCSIAVQ